MIRAPFAIAFGAAALAGCTTTTSFAPPPVAVHYANEDNASFACAAGGRKQSTAIVTRNVEGAYRLVDAFIETYRCSAHSVANGRQALEIPAFLATTGAAGAVALGGGSTFGIIGTGASSLFNAGNQYWDPKLKAAIYDHALDALLCIKTEAVGIPAYKFDNAAAEKARSAGFQEPGKQVSTVTVTPEKQYFEMVSAAAFSVERILAQRLSSMAPVDAAAVAAQLKDAMEATAAKEKERENANAGTPAGRPGGGNGNAGLIDLLAGQRRTSPNQEAIRLDLEVLKPKLDECVVRAKL